MKRIILFASGGGTNAEAILRHFSKNKKAEVVLLVSNKPSGAISKALAYDVPALILDRAVFLRDEKFVAYLKKLKPDLIVLAGFLLLVPKEFIAAFPQQIINIHPALLPKFGGKGMYGKRVHEAVVAAGEKESGITIHEVNEKFDEGKILFQSKFELKPGETAESLTNKMRSLEHLHFPLQIEKILGV